LVEEDEDFNWRLEEACANAWPPATVMHRDGWQLRWAGGSIRRSNSVNPLPGRRGAPEAIIGFAEKTYEARGQKAIFRIPAIADDLDEALADRGYVEHVRTLTLSGALAEMPQAAADPAVRLLPDPDRRWFDARKTFSGANAHDQAIYEAMTGLILVPARFASIEEDGRIAAQAYGTIHRGVLVLESVATDPAFRKRGLARRVVAALMDWGRSEGADTAALQCIADNEPALALYRSLGFSRMAYAYHYRIRA
jgi:ribosomal protein S18 acetylase RimI-like enzyme